MSKTLSDMVRDVDEHGTGLSYANTKFISDMLDKIHNHYPPVFSDGQARYIKSLWTLTVPEEWK